MAIFLSTSLAEAAIDYRVGVATVDITPPLGIPMAGYYHERGADGVLDSLYSKAMVIESGGDKLALVVVDIISVTREITDQARLEIQKSAGIPGTQVMISATHAHTGPELANRNNRSPAMGGQRQIAVDYTAQLPKRIAESVCLANEKLRPARLSTTRGRCENLAYNRRYFMRDGSVGWNPGKLNPNIGLPAGPSDPEVGIFYAESPEATGPAQAIATYVNFAMHPDTTGGSKFSADWPGALGRVLAGYHGAGHLTLTANGTCGNINNFDFFWKWPNSGAFEQNRIGVILGATVFQAYKDLKPLSAAPLTAKIQTVELALPGISPEEVAAARKTLDTVKDDSGGNFMKLVRAYRALDVAAREGKPLQVEVQAMALGKELAWIGLPGEVFVEIGLAIKKRSPFPQTMVVELANENIGYIPDRRSYAEGNYEPESARCAAGSGERLADAAVQMLIELREKPPVRRD